jgi:uncharacterized protein YecE (DUF72 family)
LVARGVPGEQHKNEQDAQEHKSGTYLHIGCSGWSYKDWVGNFYPAWAKPSEYLTLYSRVFDCVEIDSTFYRSPNAQIVKSFKEKTPKNFIFTAKLPKKMTHEHKLRGVESNLGWFEGSISKLKEKLGPIVVQLPPSFKYDKDKEALRSFLNVINPRIRYAVEFRNKSWFCPEVFAWLEDHGVCFAWSLNQYLATPPEVTTDFVYLRLVGDRQITEFRGIQRDQSVAMQEWYKNLEKVYGSVKDAYVFFNNHFAGFGPASVNEFRRLAGLMEQDWSNILSEGSRQATLED